MIGEEANYCRVCGKRVRVGARFCPTCKKNLDLEQWEKDVSRVTRRRRLILGIVGFVGVWGIIQVIHGNLFWIPAIVTLVAIFSLYWWGSRQEQRHHYW